ncbi:MAG: hypothetical protein MJK12_02600 [Colwellia sp.]|nr:hypothetical protein [Colwellia sp.]
MKLQFLRLFLLFISAVSLHGASAAPLESVLENSYVLEAPSIKQSSIEQLLLEVKARLTVQSQIDSTVKRPFHFDYSAVAYPLMLIELEMQTNITWHQQSLITINNIPLLSFNPLPQYSQSRPSQLYSTC